MNTLSSTEPGDYIVVCESSTKHVLLIRNIIRLESKRVYTIIYLRSSQQIVCSRHLKAVFEELHSDLFFRIHKSHVINMTEIKAIHMGRGGQVVMNDNSVIDVSQRKKTAFLKSFNALRRLAS